MVSRAFCCDWILSRRRIEWAGVTDVVRAGAPRLLQAIAADGVIPFINPFSVTNLKGEPRRALYLTATIAETGVLLANVDYIAPIITMYVYCPVHTTRRNCRVESRRRRRCVLGLRLSYTRCVTGDNRRRSRLSSTTL